MTAARLVMIAAILITGLSFAARSADKGNAVEGSTQQTKEAVQKCRKAMVNPVTGHTFCLEPRGAPIDDAPPADILNKPCRERAHDDDPFTVYERYSACD